MPTCFRQLIESLKMTTLIALISFLANSSRIRVETSSGGVIKNIKRTLKEPLLIECSGNTDGVLVSNLRKDSQSIVKQKDSALRRSSLKALLSLHDHIWRHPTHRQRGCYCSKLLLMEGRSNLIICCLNERKEVKSWGEM